MGLMYLQSSVACALRNWSLRLRCKRTFANLQFLMKQHGASGDLGATGTSSGGSVERRLARVYSIALRNSATARIPSRIHMPLLPRKGILPSRPSSTLRSMRAGGPSPPKRLRTAIACHRVIWSQCFRHWCGRHPQRRARTARRLRARARAAPHYRRRHSAGRRHCRGSGRHADQRLAADRASGAARARRKRSSFFAITLGHISVEDLVHSAEGLRKSAE